MNNKIVLDYSQRLKDLNIEHSFVEHPSLTEVVDVMNFIGRPISESSATLVMKADDRYIAFIRRGDTELDIPKVKQMLGIGSLQIASPTEFTKLTGLLSGTAHFLTGLETLVDKKVLEKEYIYGGSGSLEITTKYKTEDLGKIPNSQIVDIANIKVKPIILTGDTPSGKLHIGHYVGTLENRVKLQHEYDTYILLANIHAYANDYRLAQKINENVYQVFLDNLAVGIDPNVSTIYLESGIPETLELYSYFLTMVTHARALRNPAIKDELKYKNLDPANVVMSEASVGFICYPILQAADILGFNANLVPVGEDQSPVIEQTREIARDFNKAYGDTFAIPEAMIGRVPRLVGTDGKKKMSKSGGNAILLSDDEETLKKKIQACYTDPNRIHATDTGKVEGNPVFEYHRAFNPNIEEVKDLEDRYRAGKVGDKEVKEKLFTALNTFLKPIRGKRKYYEDRPEVVKEILVEGTKRARKVVQKTLRKVKEKTGINKLIE
ncbi:tryptophan--tRNA ligase [Candidatus Shapirobacteria bacterium CG06_land_8_20_14_3_00_40_12]|uniref:Tryptophan--tRNA ligase n=2 Tax=Candidatus Shapironibacteriota TaxID=1752721 RepID=A0A2M7TTR5_9BACT|nr:MAG: tryptophan--tRNA ligase [Candidatus Shapirobacteria bacterium CG06_land_8_20_14_3_00_40_12]PIZ60322.1 MAG: tryptophan--tRNA ligase [Candidatus Shapirobacteria bacterium CG_4_10_14_0_2_um_filter_40_12]